jgi:hypothetical protein
MNGPCYLKNAVTGINTNSNIIGGRLISAFAAQSISAAASSSSVTSSAPAFTSLAAVTTAAPSTATVTRTVGNTDSVTVTTTISNTGYQCACTPTSVFVASSSSTSSNAPAATATGALSCPANNGATYTSSCGSVYAIECAADRYGNDIQGGFAPANSLESCLAACDVTPGCVDVSYVIGGGCYMKSSIGAIRENSNIYGGRQISGCTTRKLRLHRKRVAPVEPKKPVAKRAGYFGPDFTFTQSKVTATQTSTALATVSTTSVPVSGTATSTAFTLASATVTTTTSVPTTVYRIVSITTCPTASPTI